MKLLSSKRSIFLTGALVLAAGAILFFLFSAQPMVKLIRFTVFNGFELEGDAIGNVERDLVYKTAADQSLMVDLYMPLTDRYELAPVVIFSHGGGWVTGDRSTMFVGPDNEKLINRLREDGYVIANFEYRLLNETTTLTELVADHKDIVRWLRVNAERYDLDGANIGFWGQSAGGHLTLMAGLSSEHEFTGDEGLSGTPAVVSYIVNNYGVTDLREQFRALVANETSPGFLETQQIENMFGAPFDEDRDAFVENLTVFSPVTYVDRNDPPVLTLHGDADTLVSAEQGRLLQQALEASGANHETHFIADADHIFNGATADQVMEIVELTAAFIARNTHSDK